jgi:hypothetical protein
MNTNASKRMAAGDSAEIINELFILTRLAGLRMERAFPVQNDNAVTVEEMEVLRQAKSALENIEARQNAAFRLQKENKPFFAEKVLT